MAITLPTFEIATKPIGSVDCFSNPHPSEGHG